MYSEAPVTATGVHIHPATASRGPVLLRAITGVPLRAGVTPSPVVRAAAAALTVGRALRAAAPAPIAVRALRAAAATLTAVRAAQAAAAVLTAAPAARVAAVVLPAAPVVLRAAVPVALQVAAAPVQDDKMLIPVRVPYGTLTL